jgi:hypothetical protein
MASVPQRGDFVRVRARRWLVEDERAIDGLKTLRLACVDDDAQGELAEVLWDAEIDGAEPRLDRLSCANVIGDQEVVVSLRRNISAAIGAIADFAAHPPACL